MDMYTTVTIGGKDYRLRYGVKAMMDIEKQAGKKMGEAGLRAINANSPIKFNLGDKIPIEASLGVIDIDMEFMLWIWGKGLDWKESGGKPDQAAELYDTWMEEAPELDTGDRFKAFKMLALDAINLARGIDGKKLREKNEAEIAKVKADQRKEGVEDLAKIYEAKMLAEERFKQKLASIGTDSSPTALES